ncbi:MAG: 2-C-methyl-D-erythritol 2,4-cyclodiphosphate synthase [Acidimicrobiia bacterium]
MRVGWGVDVHPLGGDPPVILGGVVVDETRGVHATSDGDVAAHAVCDALLGAACLGDLGQHFPSSDARWNGASSLDLLRRVVEMAGDVGVLTDFVDVTIVAEDVRVSPHRQAIRDGLAGAMGIDVSAVSVKATTTDGLGLVGRGEGIAAMAIVTARHV